MLSLGPLSSAPLSAIPRYAPERVVAIRCQPVVDHYRETVAAKHIPEKVYAEGHLLRYSVVCVVDTVSADMVVDGVAATEPTARRINNRIFTQTEIDRLYIKVERAQHRAVYTKQKIIVRAISSTMLSQVEWERLVIKSGRC